MKDDRMHPPPTTFASYREQNEATWLMGHPGACKTGALTIATSERQSTIRWLPAMCRCHTMGCQERIPSNHAVFRTDMHNNNVMIPKHYGEMVTLKNMATSLLTHVDATLTASLIHDGYRCNYRLTTHCDFTTGTTDSWELELDKSILDDLETS